MRLGQVTSTDDAEGELLHQVSAESVTEAALEAAVAALRGDIDQTPSAVSAIKVDGKRAYQLAREGQQVELAARRVHIDRFDILGVRRLPGDVGELVDVDVIVDCSSGTYIRALARDIGAALGVGGHLTALRRTRVGGFGLDQAHTLDELAERPELSYSLDDACLTVFPRRELDIDETEATGHGRALETCGHRRRVRRSGTRWPRDGAAGRRRKPNEARCGHPPVNALSELRRRPKWLAPLGYPGQS